MESGGAEKSMPLRVLYTVNTSPQYVLAKSSQVVPVTGIDGTHDGDTGGAADQVYGRTLLQLCAITLCQSSPELMSDVTKDYSVYVLDPLEDIRSKARYGPSNSAGVAVGMGLLSAILTSSPESPQQVTGTVIRNSNDDAALEIVISLRQVQGRAPYMPHLPNPGVPAITRHPSTGGKARQPTWKCNQDSSKPIFATNPLPSFSERMSKNVDTAAMTVDQQYYQTTSMHHAPHLYYASHPAFSGHMPMPFLATGSHAPPPKVDPAHNTIAALLPTPYIGPPKRVPGRPKRKITPPSVIEIEDSPKPVLSSSNSQCPSSAPPSSQEGSTASSHGSDADISSSCSSPDPQPGPENSNAAQNAAILTALSSISSSSLNLNGISSQSPNPELVHLLKLYLAAVESQGNPAAAQSVEADIPENAHGEAAVENAVLGKENRGSVVRSDSPEKIEKPNSEARPAVAPLGTGAFNARVSSPLANGFQVDSGKTGNSRKRRLSDCAEKDSQTSASNRRAVGDRSFVENKRESMVEYSGSSSRMHAIVGKSSLFRSASASASVRTGPFVVPEWARSVPAPEPPPRFESEGKVAERKSKDKKSERIRKSTSLSRLGMKCSLTTSSPKDGYVKANENLPTKALPARLAHTASTPDVPNRMPHIAQSSPISKTSHISLFRAFDTSPCRPTHHKTSEDDEQLLATPRASASLFGSPIGASLFTPSPIGVTGHSSIRSPFGERQYDVPLSPSPSCRTTLRKKGATTPQRVSPRSQLSFKPVESDETDESDCPPNSLPIASDDDSVFKRPRTPTTPRNRLDWRSLDLPPSSPPRVSSPPSDVHELPDVDEQSIPSEVSSSDSVESSEEVYASLSSENEVPSTPKPVLRQHEFGDLLNNNWPFQENMDLSDSSEMMFSDVSFPHLSSPSTNAMFEALQNGLGEEDLSEAWKLVNDVMNPSLTSGQGDLLGLPQAWFGDVDSSDTVVEETQLSAASFNGKAADVDVATMAATAFEDLLSGCLV